MSALMYRFFNIFKDLSTLNYRWLCTRFMDKQIYVYWIGFICTYWNCAIWIVFGQQFHVQTMSLCLKNSVHTKSCCLIGQYILLSYIKDEMFTWHDLIWDVGRLFMCSENNKIKLTPNFNSFASFATVIFIFYFFLQIWS